MSSPLVKKYKKHSYLPRLVEFSDSIVSKVSRPNFLFTERIVEYPFVHTNINLKKGKILDVGCGKSLLPFELASRGYKVYAIDLFKYPHPITHPNFIYVQGDARKMPFKSNFFDVAVAVSSIEHLVEFGPREDEKVMGEVARVLKRGGRAIVTVPFGKQMVFQKKHKVYDLISLKELFAKFKILKMEFSKRVKDVWVPSSLKEVKNVRHDRTQKGWPASKAIAMIVAEKRTT